jgi:hypothetical protein
VQVENIDQPGKMKNIDNDGFVLCECNVGMEHWWNDTNTGRQVLPEKFGPLQLCPTPVLHELAWERIWFYVW